MDAFIQIINVMFKNTLGNMLWYSHCKRRKGLEQNLPTCHKKNRAIDTSARYNNTNPLERLSSKQRWTANQYAHTRLSYEGMGVILWGLPSSMLSYQCKLFKLYIYYMCLHNIQNDKQTEGNLNLLTVTSVWCPKLIWLFSIIGGAVAPLQNDELSS